MHQIAHLGQLPTIAAAIMTPAFDEVKKDGFFDNLRFTDNLPKGGEQPIYFAKFEKELLLVVIDGGLSEIEDETIRHLSPAQLGFIEVQKGVFSTRLSPAQIGQSIMIAINDLDETLASEVISSIGQGLLKTIISESDECADFDFQPVFLAELVALKGAHAAIVAASDHNFTDAFAKICTSQPPGLGLVKNDDGFHLTLDVDVVRQYPDSLQMIEDARIDISNLDAFNFTRRSGNADDVRTSPNITTELVKQGLRLMTLRGITIPADVSVEELSLRIADKVTELASVASVPGMSSSAVHKDVGERPGIGE